MKMKKKIVKKKSLPKNYNTLKEELKLPLSETFDKRFTIVFALKAKILIDT